MNCPVKILILACTILTVACGDEAPSLKSEERASLYFDHLVEDALAEGTLLYAELYTNEEGDVHAVSCIYKKAHNGLLKGTSNGPLGLSRAPEPRVCDGEVETFRLSAAQVDKFDELLEILHQTQNKGAVCDIGASKYNLRVGSAEFTYTGVSCVEPSAAYRAAFEEILELLTPTA